MSDKYNFFADPTREAYTGQDIYTSPTAGPQHRCTWCVATLAALNGGGTLLDNGFLPTRRRYPHQPHCPHAGKF